MKKYLLLALGIPSFICGTSLVYNLKIRRTFTGFSSSLALGNKAIWVGSAVPIVYFRTAHIQKPDLGMDVHSKRYGGGAILNLRYIPSRFWWAEGTTAIQKESLSSKGTATFNTSRTGFDDIVFAAGHNFFFGDAAQWTFYGLAGFPTKWQDTRFDSQESLVGSRFYSIGGGAEFSYNITQHEEKSLAGILQVRAIHFFNRKWEAVLGPQGVIQPGQLIDLLTSIRYRHNRTSVESGYNATFFVDQAALLPQRQIKSKTALRNGIYISAMHLLEHVKLVGKPTAIGCGFQFNRLGVFDANSYLAWLNITIIF